MKTTRRTFLKVTGAAPFMISSAFWANSSPNSRITCGLIGMGKQNQMLLQHFLYRTQVLAVCDVDTTRREDARNKVDQFYAQSLEFRRGGCAAYKDFQELLDRDDIDVVCIATPDHWHEIITAAALRKGKDVYCEKPLTHDIDEAKRLMKEVDANRRVLQTGSM